MICFALFLIAGGVLWESWGNVPLYLIVVFYEVIIILCYNRKVLEYLCFNFDVWFKTVNGCFMWILLSWMRDGPWSQNEAVIVCKNVFQVIVITGLIFIISVIDGLHVQKVNKLIVLGALLGYFMFFYWAVYTRDRNMFGRFAEENYQMTIFGETIYVRDTCLSNALNVILFFGKQLCYIFCCYVVNIITVAPKLSWFKDEN